MSSVMIPNLPLVTSPTLSGLTVFDQNSVTYKISFTQIQSLLGFSGGILQMAFGGTGAALSPNNGSMVYSTGSNLALTNPLTDGQVVIGATGLAPVSNTLTAGSGISINNAPGSITINSSGGGLSWNVVTLTTQNMLVNNGYIANNNFLVDLKLPPTANPGDIIRIVGLGTGLWRVSQNSGQAIHFISQDTTLGNPGHLTSTVRYDCLELVCVVANSEFSVTTSMGNIIVT